MVGGKQRLGSTHTCKWRSDYALNAPISQSKVRLDQLNLIPTIFLSLFKSENWREKLGFSFDRLEKLRNLVSEVEGGEEGEIRD
jgi:hypothetical protein